MGTVCESEPSISSRLYYHKLTDDTLKVEGEEY